ncbi:hypothetical protein YASMINEVIRUS_1239 [Yasminevirus sp. GU-2018]|uniref:Uncharacterized protein n=1 Tax=Yasminevirus sp. GU-2018 TaxID=2420051 RepID=A0A5K0U9Q1_9VIRU|nr:hypothetical protein YASMINEVIRUS_1239 [Yasminevirus sp. GU-2018]
MLHSSMKEEIKSWLLANPALTLTDDQANAVAILFSVLFCELGYSDISLDDLNFVLNEIQFKQTVPNPAPPAPYSVLFVNTINFNAQTVLDVYNSYVTKIMSEVRINNLLGFINSVNSCSMDCKSFFEGLAVAMKGTVLYKNLKIYFEGINDKFTGLLSNQRGIDLQSASTTATGIDDPTLMDLFDVGINPLNGSADNWRQKISTLSFVNTTSGDSIRRADADLAFYKNDINFTVSNIIDIILAYKKSTLISRGDASNPSSVPTVDGTSEKVKVWDVYTIKSNRYDGSSKRYRHIVIRITKINIQSGADNDNYEMDVWRF